MIISPRVNTNIARHQVTRLLQLSGLDKLSSAQNELIGDLSVGVIDNTVSDANSPLIAALGKLNSESPKIRLRLHASQLDEVERGVVEGRLIVGIVPVYQRREEFDYFPVYEEKAHIYCALGHPLFTADDITPEVLRQYEVVNHRYAIHRDKTDFVNYDSQSASASQVEAVVILVLTGRFLGFLPEHYAAPLVREGRVRALCPVQVHLSTAFNLILRHNALRSPMVKAFAIALGVDLKATT